MERVQGIGGIFFKAKDPKALALWYSEHLGLELEGWGGSQFVWSQHDHDGRAATIWSPFAADTSYFGPGPQQFMLNFRVASLDRMLAQLREAGVAVDERVERSEHGHFGWCTDPEGNRVELWEPPAGA